MAAERGDARPPRSSDFTVARPHTSRTTAAALVPLQPGRAVEHELDLEVLASVRGFEPAAQPGQGQRRQPSQP
jgi:hypothetical protein